MTMPEPWFFPLGRAKTGMLLLPLLLAQGCSDPAFQKKQDRRSQRIATANKQFWERESKRPQDIRWWLDVQKAGDARRDENLREDYYVVRDRFHTDVQTTAQNFRELDRWGKGVLRGRLENVHPYIVDVWY